MFLSVQFLAFPDMSNVVWEFRIFFVIKLLLFMQASAIISNSNLIDRISMFFTFSMVTSSFALSVKISACVTWSLMYFLVLALMY